MAALASLFCEDATFVNRFGHYAARALGNDLCVRARTDTERAQLAGLNAPTIVTGLATHSVYLHWPLACRRVQRFLLPFRPSAGGGSTSASQHVLERRIRNG
jgi:hypothetical protein